MERKWLMSIEIVILSGASRSFIARGAVEGPAVAGADNRFRPYQPIRLTPVPSYRSIPPRQRRNIANIGVRRDGGTGRRSGLKIRRGQPRGGSTPPPGTKITKDL